MYNTKLPGVARVRSPVKKEALDGAPMSKIRRTSSHAEVRGPAAPSRNPRVRRDEFVRLPNEP